MRIKIVGFDPSISNFGCVYAEMDKQTKKIELLAINTIQPVIEKSKTRSLEDLGRFRQIHASVHQWLELHNPDVVFAELPFGSQSSRAMVNYAACIAIISSVKHPLIPVTPFDVKKVVMTAKNASKAEIIEWAVAKHPSQLWKTRMLKGKRVVQSSNEHAADALAAIYAGLEKPSFKNLFN